MADASFPLTFGQRQGVEALPSQMNLTTISPHLIATMWSVFYKQIDDATYTRSGSSVRLLREWWKVILKDYWVDGLHKNIDEFKSSPSVVVELVKFILTQSKYVRFFNFIQFVIEHPLCPHDLPIKVDEALTRTHAAYRLCGKLIVPVTSPEQGEAVRQALATAASATAKGPFAHLKNASGYLTEGAWAASVRESISAVEGAAKAVEPGADTLGKALSKLKTSIGLNEAMAAAFKQLYGYTSDLQGIRHAQVFDGHANVTQRDALFMFGACASFVSYLLSSTTK